MQSWKYVTKTGGENTYGKIVPPKKHDFVNGALFAPSFQHNCLLEWHFFKRPHQSSKAALVSAQTGQSVKFPKIAFNNWSICTRPIFLKSYIPFDFLSPVCKEQSKCFWNLLSTLLCFLQLFVLISFGLSQKMLWKHKRFQSPKLKFTFSKIASKVHMKEALLFDWVLWKGFHFLHHFPLTAVACGLVYELETLPQQVTCHKYIESFATH